MAGIIIPVTLIVLISSLFMLFDGQKAPGSNFENVAFLDNVEWKEIKPDGSTNINMTNPPTYSFVKQFVKTLKLPEKVAAISQIKEPEMIFLNNSMYDLNIRYTDDEFWQITDFKFIEGRPFNNKEFDRGDRNIVIDEKTSKAFFATTKSIGKTIEIKNTAYTIIGVVENIDITQHRFASNVYIPFTCSNEFNSGLLWSGECMAFILMKDKKDFDLINDEFRQNMKHVNFSDKAAFEGMPINYLKSGFNKDNYLARIEDFAGIDKKMLLVIVLLVTFFFIIFPAINLANINMNRIHERLSETGVRKTFGATVSTLITQFLLENIIIVAIGSILSILLAWIISSAINQFDLITGIHLQIDLKVLLISLLSVLTIGILSGIIPSIRMAKSSISKSINSVQ